jgi:hypothetical protein
VTTVLARFRSQRHLTSARTRALYTFCCALVLTQDFNCDIDSGSQEFISFGFLIIGRNNLMSECNSRSELVRMPMTQLGQTRQRRCPIWSLRVMVAILKQPYFSGWGAVADGLVRQADGFGPAQSRGEVYK